MEMVNGHQWSFGAADVSWTTIAHVKYMKAEQLKIMCNRRMASADYARWWRLRVAQQRSTVRYMSDNATTTQSKKNKKKIVTASSSCHAI